MVNLDQILAIAPLTPVAVLLVSLLDNPVPSIRAWLSTTEDGVVAPPLGVQLAAYLGLALLGYVATDRLVPNIKAYTLRKGISGKDLGKRGTPLAEKPM